MNIIALYLRVAWGVACFVFAGFAGLAAANMVMIFLVLATYNPGVVVLAGVCFFWGVYDPTQADQIANKALLSRLFIHLAVTVLLASYMWHTSRKSRNRLIHALVGNIIFGWRRFLALLVPVLSIFLVLFALDVLTWFRYGLTGAFKVSVQVTAGRMSRHMQVYQAYMKKLRYFWPFLVLLAPISLALFIFFIFFDLLSLVYYIYFWDTHFTVVNGHLTPLHPDADAAAAAGPDDGAKKGVAPKQPVGWNLTVSDDYRSLPEDLRAQVDPRRLSVHDDGTKWYESHDGQELWQVGQPPETRVHEGLPSKPSASAKPSVGAPAQRPHWRSADAE